MLFTDPRYRGRNLRFESYLRIHPPPGDGEDHFRTLGRTPRITKFFARLLRVFSSETPVWDIPVGGLKRDTLYDIRAYTTA